MKNVTIYFFYVGNFEKCSFTNLHDQILSSATMKGLDCSMEQLDQY